MRTFKSIYWTNSSHNKPNLNGCELAIFEERTGKFAVMDESLTEPIMQAAAPRPPSLLWKCLSSISVEPALTLYMLAFMTTSVVEQAFFVDKACRVDHGFNDTVCSDITNKNYKELNKELQITVARFQKINDTTGHVVPLILAFFMGAWSDKRGRKIPMLMGLIGKLYYSSMIIVNALQPTWSVFYVAYTATIPSSLTGADVVIFASALAYLADVTPPESRTMRMTIMEACYLATMPIGIAIGSPLFTYVTNKSFAAMFAINATLLAVSILYVLIFLKYRTTNAQRPCKEAPNIISDFFDYNHAWSTIKTVIKPREDNRRTYLILMLATMACYTFQRDEKHTAYLYFQDVMSWTFTHNSNFRTFVSAIQDVFLLAAVPIMSKVWHWKDASIMIFGAICHSVARFFYIFARTDWLIYIGGVFNACGPIVQPCIRSSVTKLVPSSERGKALAMLSLTDNAILMLTGYVYNQVFEETSRDHPTAIFYVTIATQFVVLLLSIFFYGRGNLQALNETTIKSETTEASS